MYVPIFLSILPSSLFCILYDCEIGFDCRRADLEALGASLKQYRDGHSELISWIEETTRKQEDTQAGQTDSRALSEQLAQQTVSISF